MEQLERNERPTIRLFADAAGQLVHNSFRDAPLFYMASIPSRNLLLPLLCAALPIGLSSVSVNLLKESSARPLGGRASFYSGSRIKRSGKTLLIQKRLEFQTILGHQLLKTLAYYLRNKRSEVLNEKNNC